MIQAPLAKEPGQTCLKVPATSLPLDSTSATPRFMTTDYTRHLLPVTSNYARPSPIVVPPSGLTTPRETSYARHSPAPLLIAQALL